MIGVGKAVSLRLVQESDTFRVQASIFLNQSATKEKIAAAGEKQWYRSTKAKKQILSMTSDWNVFTVRWLTSKWLSTLTTCQQRLQLLRFIASECTIKFKNGWETCYHQTHASFLSIVPVHSDLDPAPLSLFEFVRCEHKSGCSTMLCNCRRQGLDCSLASLLCVGGQCLKLGGLVFYNVWDIEIAT